MGYEVILSPRAIEDLRDIVFYISPDRPDAARRLALALVEKTKVLESFPNAGRKVPELGDPQIRELVLHPYRIVYRVDEERKRIGVARFWHGARDAVATDDL